MNRAARRRAEAQRLNLVERKAPAQTPGPAILVLMPSRGRITVETASCLASAMDGIPHAVSMVSRLPIVDARNQLFAAARSFVAHPPVMAQGGWYCLWVDDDAFWRPGTVRRLLSAIGGADKIDLLGGWFCGRQPYSNPKATRLDGSWPRIGHDCQAGDVVEVDHLGFHFILHRAELLNRLPDAAPFVPYPALGEDASFCDRVREAGGRIWVDTGAPVAHVDDDGHAYLPGEGAMRVVAGQLQIKEEQPRRTYGREIDETLAIIDQGGASVVDSMGTAAIAGYGKPIGVSQSA